MAKMMIIIMMIFAFSSLLYMSGVTYGNSGNAIGIISQFLQNGNLQDTDVYFFIFTIALVALVGGATLTAITFGNANASTVIANAAMSIFLANLVSDFFFVLQYVETSCVEGAVCTDWVYWIIFPIFITLGFGGLWSIYDYVIGND